MLDLVEALRLAIVDSDMSRYEIAVEAGISHTIVTRFINNNRDIRLETASRIASVLDLELVPRRSGKKKR
ncbi:MAG: helix-turn-helix transcriptional regulator [Pirellulaceae bacterium]|jgi:plasmid maintenance system antidote protein VapI|nr:helix-turn-helix transcriptional regulator [Pirellulaceae bacterium]